MFPNLILLHQRQVKFCYSRLPHWCQGPEAPEGKLQQWGPRYWVPWLFPSTLLSKSLFSSAVGPHTFSHLTSVALATLAVSLHSSVFVSVPQNEVFNLEAFTWNLLHHSSEVTKKQLFSPEHSRHSWWQRKSSENSKGKHFYQCCTNLHIYQLEALSRLNQNSKSPNVKSSLLSKCLRDNQTKQETEIWVGGLK